MFSPKDSALNVFNTLFVPPNAGHVVMLRLPILYLLIVVLSCLSVCGCRTTDPRSTREISLLRAEVVDWEDQYFSLKAKHRKTVNELRRCKGLPELEDETSYYSPSSNGEIIEDGSIEPWIEDGPNSSFCDDIYLGPTTIESYETTPSQRSTTRPSPKKSPTPAPNREQIPTPPALKNGGSANGDVDSIRSNSLPLDSNNETSANRQPQSREQNPRFRTASATQSVAEIQINRTSTHGHDVDGQPGDEGLVVLVQPMTLTGSVIQQAGKLTISIIDPMEQGSAQRIGLWRFSSEDVEKFFIKEEYLDQGILLHLPWDLATPKHRRLQVHARFTTLENKVLESSIELKIIPPIAGHSANENLVAQWIENDDRWIDAFGHSGQNDHSSPAQLTNESGLSFRASSAKSNRRNKKSRWRPKR